jgi:hypothetical protein
MSATLNDDRDDEKSVSEIAAQFGIDAERIEKIIRAARIDVSGSDDRGPLYSVTEVSAACIERGVVPEIKGIFKVNQ